MPTFKIQHITQYIYDREVKESANQLKIFPPNNSQQKLIEQVVTISGHPDIFYYTDYWGNTAGQFTIIPPHSELTIDSRTVIETKPSQIKHHISTMDEWKTLENLGSFNFDIFEYTIKEKLKASDTIEQILHSILLWKETPLATIQRCSEYIYEEFKYIKGITTVESTIDEILTLKSGVCQDFSHLLLHLLRSLHIPARYVSGYICPHENGMRGEGATHAWVEAWLPSQGWIGIDPTNNCWVSDQHVQLAIGRNFDDCTPIKGTFKGPAYHELSVYVSVGYEDGTIFQDSNLVLEAKEINTDTEQAFVSAQLLHHQ